MANFKVVEATHFTFSHPIHLQTYDTPSSTQAIVDCTWVCVSCGEHFQDHEFRVEKEDALWCISCYELALGSEEFTHAPAAISVVNFTSGSISLLQSELLSATELFLANRFTSTPN